MFYKSRRRLFLVPLTIPPDLFLCKNPPLTILCFFSRGMQKAFKSPIPLQSMTSFPIFPSKDDQNICPNSVFKPL